MFGIAQQMATCLGSSRVAPWVNPGPTPRPEFNPHQLVRRGGTLYRLSREGAGNAGPLVTALTVAVVKAAEDYATTCPGGRLRGGMLWFRGSFWDEWSAPSGTGRKTSLLACSSSSCAATIGW
ncbi:hypothetical protein AB0H36_37790 [Kribbella sp. NPDC050820]|uniref:hypothetical protein n=1 Tax=Kribbella sp. NPDC050820 TaxID=3155408 RepID=UPI0033DB8375